jgi:peptidoglycan/LPS O-acetylase OafA/YrhL
VRNPGDFPHFQQQGGFLLDHNQPSNNLIPFDPVNFLRVLAAGLVFLLHTSLFMNDPLELSDHGVWTILVRPSAWSGVWIFFLLSGYLCQKGFLSGKYPLTLSGVGAFYLRRIRKVWFPGICFVFLCCILIYPTFLTQNPGVLIQFLTCTYTGVPGVNGIGATWFIFTLMWLYLAAPLFALLLSWLSNKPRTLALLLAGLALLGCGYRLTAYYLNWDWSQRVYAAPYGNIDLFFCGMGLSLLTAKSNEQGALPRPLTRLLSCAFLVACVLLGGYCNYTSLPFFKNLMHTSIMPTLMLLSGGLFLWSFDRIRPAMPSASPQTPLGIFYRLINRLSQLAFAFYLFHSVVLYAISENIVSGGGAKEYFVLLVLTFIFTLILSIGWTRIFRRIPGNSVTSL